jgi:hypothetical protein
LTKQTPTNVFLDKAWNLLHIIHAINAALLLILTSFQRDCPAVAIAAAAAAAATIGDALWITFGSRVRKAHGSPLISCDPLNIEQANPWVRFERDKNKNKNKKGDFTSQDSEAAHEFGTILFFFFFFFFFLEIHNLKHLTMSQIHTKDLEVVSKIELGVI